jgi:hypothetical protein
MNFLKWIPIIGVILTENEWLIKIRELEYKDKQRWNRFEELTKTHYLETHPEKVKKYIREYNLGYYEEVKKNNIAKENYERDIKSGKIKGLMALLDWDPPSHDLFYLHNPYKTGNRIGVYIPFDSKLKLVIESEYIFHLIQNYDLKN